MSKLNVLIVGSLALILIVRLISFSSGVAKYKPGTIISWDTQLLTEPKITARGQKFSVFMPNYERVSITAKLLPFFTYGDKLRIKGEIQYFEAGRGKQIAFMTYPEIKILENSESNLLYSLRETIIKFFNSALPAKEAALILGITFGIKEEMSASFEADLQKAGLMHVIAASGMNITMLGGFLAAVFTLFLRRQSALIASILGILFYTALAGFEPSIVRAAVMGSLVFGASIIGRQSTAFITLFAAAFAMLMINPSLIYDIGFQLSFMATAGLVYLRPLFFVKPGLKVGIERSILGEDLVTTLTAQLATLPILLVNFGSYSPWSIFVNAIVLWTVPFVMIVGGVAGVIGLVIEPLGKLVSYFSMPFLLYFIKVTEFFGGFQSQISINSIPFMIIGGYYLVLFAIILWLRDKL